MRVEGCGLKGFEGVGVLRQPVGVKGLWCMAGSFHLQLGRKRSKSSSTTLGAGGRHDPHEGPGHGEKRKAYLRGPLGVDLRPDLNALRCLALRGLAKIRSREPARSDANPSPESHHWGRGGKSPCDPEPYTPNHQLNL